jgi:hypothetical protein
MNSLRLGAGLGRELLRRYRLPANGDEFDMGAAVLPGVLDEMAREKSFVDKTFRRVKWGLSDPSVCGNQAS